MNRASFGALLLAFALLMPLHISAQSSRTDTTAGRTSFDVFLGPAVARSNARKFLSGGLTAGVTIGIHPSRESHRSFAISGGWQSGNVVPRGDVCTIDAPIVEGEKLRCRQPSPAMTHLGALAGFQWRHPAQTYRVLLGPAIFRGEGRTAPGAQLELDAALGGARHVALVLVSRSSLAFRSDGETLRMTSLGLGIRGR